MQLDSGEAVTLSQEELRLSFQPQRVTTMFVGESVPHGGTFFYQRDSVLYRATQEAFGGPDDFLIWFRDEGFYLVDLVPYPINHIRERSLRNHHRSEAVPSLASLLALHKPEAVVILMKAIKKMVVQAMVQADMSNVPYFSVPFPGRFHRQRFLDEIQAIIPKLPRVNSGGGPD